MSLRYSALAIAATLCAAQMGLAQSSNSADEQASVTVTIDGLSCGGSRPNSFTATDFAVEVNDTSGTGGGGAGKVVFTDVAILKSPDNCSVPLIAAAGARILPRVTILRAAKGATVALTVVLENVQVASAFARASGDETIDLSYQAITITDAAGNTTGRIVRQPGSVPISPFAAPLPGVVQM